MQSIKSTISLGMDLMACDIGYEILILVKSS